MVLQDRIHVRHFVLFKKADTCWFVEESKLWKLRAEDSERSLKYLIKKSHLEVPLPRGVDDDCQVSPE